MSWKKILWILFIILLMMPVASAVLTPKTGLMTVEPKTFVTSTVTKSILIQCVPYPYNHFEGCCGISDVSGKIQGIRICTKVTGYIFYKNLKVPFSFDLNEDKYTFNGTITYGITLSISGTYWMKDMQFCGTWQANYYLNGWFKTRLF